MSEQTFSLKNLSEKQLRIIQESLDLYSRLLCGQLDELIWFFKKHTDFKTDEHIDNTILELKRRIFPQLPERSFYGIAGKKTPNESKIAYDMLCVIRNGLAWHKQPSGGFMVDFDKPLNISHEPLIVFQVEEEPQD